MQKTANIGIAIALTAALIGIFPASALGAQPTYETRSMDVTAQVRTDGSLHVVDQRAFAFDGEFDCLRWQFTGLPADAEVSVASVRMAQTDEAAAITGDWITLQRASFNSAWREIVEGSADNAAEKLADLASASKETPQPPAPNTWMLDERQRALYIFFAQTADQMLFEVDWTAADAVAAYDDVAELYWDYVPTRDDTETLSVSATVQLPVPEGAQVTPGETILAWGHGAPGQLDVEADGTVTYEAPEVRRGQYAQAHVLFPASWLTNLSIEARQAYSGTRLDYAKAEEEAWTDTYSNQLVNQLAVNIAVAVVCAALLAAAIVLYITRGRERRRDLPQIGPDELRRLTGDAPLMARFTAWNHVSPDETDPDALTRRMAEEGLFDARSFQLQKALFIGALVLIGAAVVALFAFGNWPVAGMLLATGICIAIIANYLPRRTPKGIALAAALNEAAERE